MSAEGREEPDWRPVMSGPNTADAILHTGGRKSIGIFVRQYTTPGGFL
jgi:hypothetical protein